MEAWYIKLIATEIREGCQKAGCGNFTTEVTLTQNGVTFSFPLFVPATQQPKDTE